MSSSITSPADFEEWYTLVPAYGGKSTRQHWAQECTGLELAESEERGTVPFFN